MSGIDRLRGVAYLWNDNELRSIADQIEREGEEYDRRQSKRWTIVWWMVREMEQHVSGVKGAEDSPVARWARELRYALKSDTSDERDAQNPSCAHPAETADVTSEAEKVTRDPVEDVSMSAYDLLPQEEREAIAWVREHGGLERVKQQRYESIPRAAYERKRRALLGHIAECETALGKRREAIARLADENDALRLERAQMRPRLMPEGMEWPTVDGKPVDFTTGYEPSLGVLEAVSIYSNGACEVMSHDGIIKNVKDIHVLKPKVLDADGAEIRVGDEVFVIATGKTHHVTVIDHIGKRFKSMEQMGDDATWLDPSLFTHRAPVLAADGRPLREGETVWDKDTGDRFEVDGFSEDGFVVCWDLDKCEADIEIKPSQLTHERPVVDTWERLEEDAGKNPFDYCKDVGHRLDTCENSEAYKALDLVRRAKALAGRDA